MPSPTPITSVAIVPAAGRSARMGEHKLLLRWGEGTVIEAVLAAWRASGVSKTIVVVRADDRALIDVCLRAGAEVVEADPPPPDMKASVGCGLSHLQALSRHARPDVWLLAPADMPTLDPAVIDRLLARWHERPGEIFVPIHDGRRGHPLLLSWSIAKEIPALGTDEGINALLARHELQQIECPATATPADLDTPDNYRRLKDRYDR
ncbi:MAG: nucleotidyltransferase family protein [Planctomycetes bacterium]|nr:nucleotidyltransferase family protein [Planctomycetota bacterium]